MSEVVFKIEREDGELFIIDDTEWRIPNDGLSGWHTTNSNISMFENTNSDGSIITQQRVPAVDRTITAEARDSSASAYLRTIAERFFVPHKTFYVYATYMGRTRKFEGVQAAFTLSEGNIHKPITLVWTITCPSPYSSDSEPSVGKSPYSMLSHGSGMPYRVFMKDHDGYRKGFVTGVFRNAPEPGIGIDMQNVIALVNGGDVGTRPTFYVKVQKTFNGSSTYNGSLLEIDIQELEVSAGKYEPTMRRLTVVGIDWSFGGEDPSEQYTRNLTDYVKIDLSARPFKLEAISVNQNGQVVSTERIGFNMVFDSLVRNPYVEQGESFFEVKATIKDNDGISNPNKEIKKYATIENLYTGV